MTSPPSDWPISAVYDHGWPQRIDDPLPLKSDVDPLLRLHDTIKCLNRGLASEADLLRQRRHGERRQMAPGDGENGLRFFSENFDLPQTSLAAAVLGCSTGGCQLFGSADSEGTMIAIDDGQKSNGTPPAESSVPSLEELFTSDPDQFVARYTDIGAVNLASARGLPQADGSQFPRHVALLDTIAEAVRRHTERSWRLFKLKPAQFEHSENVFRVYTMEHVFRVQFGIRYDPLVHEVTESGTPWNTVDSSQIFIHGILGEKRTGTCSSLPTFAVAVGRRLGYPLKLVLVPNHTLYRWDDGNEVFNFQHTEAGGDIRPDEYFYEWPRQWDAVDHAINARTNVWLHSLTPRKEVSKFLCNRALLLRNIRRYDEAFRALDVAERFDPINPACPDIRLSVLQQMDSRPFIRTALSMTPIFAAHR